MSPTVLAHRGGAKLLYNLKLENTLSAFGRAVSLGCRWIETDVRASRDGVVYIVHDADLRRLAGLPYRIEETDSEVLDQVRIGAREPMPRLSEALDAFSGIGFNIDVKSDRTVAPLVRLLRGRHHDGGVRLASFDTTRLVRLREALPGVRTSVSQSEFLRLLSPGPFPASLRYPNIDSAQIPYRWRGLRITGPRVIASLHRRGLAVHVWTVDDEPSIRRLLAWDVDGIVTDRPDLALALVEETSRR